MEVWEGLTRVTAVGLVGQPPPQRTSRAAAALAAILEMAALPVLVLLDYKTETPGLVVVVVAGPGFTQPLGVVWVFWDKGRMVQPGVVVQVQQVPVVAAALAALTAKAITHRVMALFTEVAACIQTVEPQVQTVAMAQFD
jgi:hypothetical protein